MPTSPYFPSYYGGTSGEQGLVQDLVDEQIKLFGTDIYYLPRTLITDGVLDDIIYNKFESQFQVEMLLQNVEGFGSPSEFISKFGLRITDEVRFIVSQRRWEAASDSYTLTVPTRPNEGDLLYFPLTKDLYEIKFVEREDPFYQLGKIYYYTMTAEIYEYGSDDISTGVQEIDVLETLLSPSILLFMDPGGISNFTVGEEVVGDEFLAKADANLSGGSITSITITDSGSNYSSTLPPSVTIGSPPAPGSVTNMQTSNDNGVFDTDAGTGYLSGVTYNTTTMTNYGPGTGSGLTIRIDNLSGQGGVRGSGGQTMSNITIINSGSGYTKDLTGSGGSQGSLVRVDGGNDDLYLRVNYVSVTSPATATANVSSTGIVNGITITDAGSGYISEPIVTIDYSPKDNRAEVKSWDASTRKLEIVNRTGTFTTAETITGLTSGAKWSPESYDTLNNTNSEYDQNREIETAADDIIDWTEGNPFGEAGNFTGSI
jgi:hypothetical protein